MASGLGLEFWNENVCVCLCVEYNWMNLNRCQQMWLDYIYNHILISPFSFWFKHFILLLLLADADVESANKTNYNAGAVDVIQNAMGAFGLWHMIVCGVVFLLKFPVAWHQMSTIFLAPKADFVCSDDQYVKCDVNCPSHAFNRSIFTETIITEWDLVCSRAQLSNLSQTIFMSGILVGNILFGSLSDK